LHFEYTSRVFYKSDEIIKLLKDKNHIDYSKGSTDIFQKTKTKLDIAMKNAKSIQKYQRSSNPKGTKVYELNPYTNIDILIEQIISLQENG